MHELLLVATLLAAPMSEIEWATRETAIAAYATTSNHHDTDRYIEVMSGNAEYRDVRGVRQLAPGDMLFIPATMHHELRVGAVPLILRSAGFTSRGEPLPTCAGGP
jgi:mannose-6-phosphate isomerase-like protein (cupin superfamily)